MKLAVHVKCPCPSEESTIARAADAPLAARARRRLCSSSASQTRRWPRVIGGLFDFRLGNIFAIVRFRFVHLLGLVPVGNNLCRFRFNRRQLVVLRKERPPLPPDDGIKFVHNFSAPLRLCGELDCVGPNGDLFPVRPIADGDARHRTSATSRQVDDAAWKLGRRDTGSHRGRNVGKCWDLDLFTRANPLKTARNNFAHIVRWKSGVPAHTSTPLV